MHQSIFRKGEGRHLSNLRMAISQGAYCFPQSPVAETPQERFPAQPGIPAGHQGPTPSRVGDVPRSCPHRGSAAQPGGCPLPAIPSRALSQISPEQGPTAPRVPPALRHHISATEGVGVSLTRREFIKKNTLFSLGTGDALRSLAPAPHMKYL